VEKVGVEKGEVVKAGTEKGEVEKGEVEKVRVEKARLEDEYEWGLGIEHEFVPVIKIQSFAEYAAMYKLLNGMDLDRTDPNVKKLKKIMDGIRNHFYLGIPMMHHTLEDVYPFANYEWTGVHHFPMLETKNMIFRNQSCHKILKELSRNTAKIIELFNTMASKYFGTSINFIEPHEGAAFLLHQDMEEIPEEFSASEQPTIVYKKNNPITILSADTTGSYHFWITLPHKSNDDWRTLHQRAGYLLQTIEPLLIGVYCSPDPRINRKNKKYVFGGSFRGGVNAFANYGTSMLADYDSPVLQDRQMNFRTMYLPSNIGNDHYMFQIRKKYNISDTIYGDKLGSDGIKPDYIALRSYMSKKNYYDSSHRARVDTISVGLNIRRKSGIRGFEFRIMDHLPESDLPNLAKVIYLCACMSYEVASANLTFASANQHWHNMITNTLFAGYGAEVIPGYIDYLESQFAVKIGAVNGVIDTLEKLCNACWEKCAQNPANGLWRILGKDRSPPIIKSKNKEILAPLLMAA
jgi:hypothetical protein